MTDLALITFVEGNNRCACPRGLLPTVTHALLSSAWPKSLAARRFSSYKAQSGRPLTLPTLVLLQCGGDEGHVADCPFADRRTVGHAKLSATTRNGILLESVVIAPDLRGKGLGKAFMRLLEERVRVDGYDALWLSTVDAAAFYESVGFTRTTERVSCLGQLGNRVQAIASSTALLADSPPATATPAAGPSVPSALPPPPPPPPPPAPSSPTNTPQQHVWMKKELNHS